MHQKNHREYAAMPSKKRQEISKQADEEHSKMKKKEHASRHQYKDEGVIHDFVEKAGNLASAPVKKTKKLLKRMYSSQ